MLLYFIPFPLCCLVCFQDIVGRLRFHYDNEYENDIEISLSFSSRFCTQKDERLIASNSSSTTTITNRNSEITQEMRMYAHKNFVLVLVVVVLVKSIIAENYESTCYWCIVIHEFNAMFFYFKFSFLMFVSCCARKSSLQVTLVIPCRYMRLLN